MTKKIPLGITLALIFLSILITSVVTVTVYLNLNDSLLTDLPEKALQYSKLSEVDELVRQEYYGDIDRKSVDLHLAKGMLSGLNDPYSYFISSDEYEAYTALLEGNMYGVGISAYFEPQVSALKVNSVEVGSPAENVGITSSSYIYSVDGVAVSESSYTDILDKLLNSKNKKMSVVFSADGSENITDIEIKSGYKVYSCDYSVDNNIGYIRISALYEDTVSQFSSAFEAFNAEGIKNVIIDLRNCSSANLDVASEIIDIIVPVGNEGSGAIFTAKNINGDVIKQVSSASDSVNFSIVVLINSRSECASELIAQDLKDFGKAVLVGETTAGHGTMQKTFKLDDGSAVSLTVGKIYPYISESFDEIGVKPDYEILTSEAFKNSEIFKDYENDEQYQYACSYFNGSN